MTTQIQICKTTRLISSNVNVIKNKINKKGQMFYIKEDKRSVTKKHMILEPDPPSVKRREKMLQRPLLGQQRRNVNMNNARILSTITVL